MRVRAKLGCLRKVERVSQTSVRQEFATWSMNLDLPDEGKRDEEGSCPVCGCPLELRLSSLSRAQVTLAAVLLGVALAVGLGGFLGMAYQADAYVVSGQHAAARSQGKDATFGPGDSATCRSVAWVAFGVAGLILVGAAAATAMPASLFVATGWLVVFSREPRNFSVSNVQGHRVLQVDPLTDRVPAEVA